MAAARGWGAARVEWTVPGWRRDESAPGAVSGLILGVVRDPACALAFGAKRPPTTAVTYGSLHTVTDGSENLLLIPGAEWCVGVSDPAAVDDAIAAFRA